MAYLNIEFPDVEGSSLLFSNFQADRRDRESLLFVALALLSLARLALGPFSLLLVARELSLDLNLDGHGAAVGSGLDLGLNLDGQVLLEKGLAADEEDVAVGLLGSVKRGLELEARVGLALAVLSLDDGVGKGLNSLGAWQVLGGLVGSITGGSLDEEFSVSALGNLDHVLDSVGAARLKRLLDLSLQFVQGVEGVLLTQKGNNDNILSRDAVLVSFHGFGLGGRFERAGFTAGGGLRGAGGRSRLLLSTALLLLLATLLLFVLLALLARADVHEELLTLLRLAGGGGRAGRGLLGA